MKKETINKFKVVISENDEIRNLLSKKSNSEISSDTEFTEKDLTFENLKKYVRGFIDYGNENDPIERRQFYETYVWKRLQETFNIEDYFKELVFDETSFFNFVVNVYDEFVQDIIFQLEDRGVVQISDLKYIFVKDESFEEIKDMHVILPVDSIFYHSTGKYLVNEHEVATFENGFRFTITCFQISDETMIF